MHGVQQDYVLLLQHQDRQEHSASDVRQDRQELRQSKRVQVYQAERQRGDRYGEDFRDNGRALVCEYEPIDGLLDDRAQHPQRDHENHWRDLLRRDSDVALIHGRFLIRVQQSVRDNQQVVHYLRCHVRDQDP